MRDPAQRKDLFKEKRDSATTLAHNRPHLGPPSEMNPNEQENVYPNRVANYSKGLPHPNQQNGEVDLPAYQSLLDAIRTGDPPDFENIVLDTTYNNNRGNKKLTNPQSGLAFDLEGPDGHAVALLKPGATDLTAAASYQIFPPPPKFDSKEAAGEMVELYWMALLRDVPFTDFDTNNRVKEATDELSTLSVFNGPKQNNKVTRATIFRGSTAGDLKGPLISQFMLRGNQDDMLKRKEDDGWVKFGTCAIDQRHVVAVKDKDYVTNFNSWLAVQRGENRDIDPLYEEKDPDRDLKEYFDDKPRFIRNMRDLATYVHYDALYQAYLTACIYLLRLMDLKGENEMLNQGNPYKGLNKQGGFGTFGGPHILSLVCEVATRALKSVWYTKWYLYRRLRPEAFGGRIHLKKKGVAYDIDNEVMNSEVLGEVLEHNKDQNRKYDRPDKDGTFLLPLAFPEGSPTHPSYGAGHATVAGACVTILKAWFNENFEIENPVVPNKEGTELKKYNGNEKLTVGGELNKLAANIAIGRNMAGVHYRSDYWHSLRLGEVIAIGILEEQKGTYNETITNPLKFKFTRFDGIPVEV